MTINYKNLCRLLTLSSSLAIIFLARLYPLIKFGAGGLGYDTGFYRRQLAMPASSSFLTDGRTQPPNFILGQGADSARFILDILSWLKINTDLALFGSYLIFSLLLGLTIYLLTSRVFQNSNAGLLALILFALSPTQWLAYTFMLYKQFWAAWLLFLAFYLMESHSVFFVAPLLLALTGHRATALLSIPSLALTAILSMVKKYRMQLALITAVLIILVIWLNWPALKMLWLTWQNKLSAYDSFHLKTGVFISLSEYLRQSLIVVALGLIGAGWLIKKRRFSAFLCFFFTALVLVITKSYFYQRLIIPLDLSFIVLADGGIWLACGQIKNLKYSWLFPTIFFLLFSSNLFLTIKQYRPLISQEKLQDIIQLRDLPSNSYLLTYNSDYAPWLYGWAGPDKKIISPGLFWDQWDYQQWTDFWSGDLAKKKTMLTSYRAPLYIFSPDDDYLNDSCFEKITGQTWKFNCY